MTDKQIKDGIDVSQCECYSIEYNSCNDTLSGSCIKEKCQTFRLLQTIKTKEQECEEFRKANDEKNELLAKLGYPTTATAKRKVFCLQEQLDQFKAECLLLKDEYKILEDNLDSRTRDFEDVIDSYKQTLTEIKKIAENLAPMTDEYDNCYYKDSCSKCKFQEDCQYFKVEQILQKISEAENEITTR